jgi:hypothetical protein
MYWFSGRKNPRHALRVDAVGAADLPTNQNNNSSRYNTKTNKMFITFVRRFPGKSRTNTSLL